MIKVSFSIFTFLFSVLLFSQEQTVTVIGSGDGVNKTTATNQALRNCIEKSMGAFLSSSTVVTNDELVKDEIATIASGNIVSYEILSELNIKDNYNVTVSAIISPEQLITTLKAKGFDFELNGGVYAQNILKEKFYAEQEKIAIQNFIKTWEKVQLFDFDIQMSEPGTFKKRIDNETGQVEIGYDFECALSKNLEEPFKKAIETTNISFEYNNINFKANEYQFFHTVEMADLVSHSLRMMGICSGIFPLSYKNVEYSMSAVFSPKITPDYISFFKSFVNLVNSISIKDIDNYKKLNSHFIEVQIECSNISNLSELDLSNYPLNERGNISFYLRNVENKKLFEEISAEIELKSTGLKFTSNIFNILTTRPVFMSYEEEDYSRWFRDRGEIAYINPFYYNGNRGYTLLFSPTVYMMFFSFEELQNLKKIEFTIKD